MDSFFEAWAKQEAERLGPYSRGDIRVERPNGESWYTYGYKVVTREGRVFFFLPFNSRVAAGEILDMAREKWKVLEMISLSGGFHCAVERIQDVPTVQAPNKTEEKSRDKKKRERKRTPDPQKVFVIHGRDERLRSGIFTFLRAIGLSPLEWTEAVALTGKATPYIGEILDSAFGHAQAVVVLFTPDDEARLRESLRQAGDSAYEASLTPQARPNVLFEAGMALAHQPKRTVLVEIGRLRPFSDIGGRHLIRMDGSVKARQDLALRLQNAGCPVRLTGTDWHGDGDLTPPTDAKPNEYTEVELTDVNTKLAGVLEENASLRQRIQELESPKFEPCPRCRKPGWQIVSSQADRIWGEAGAMRRVYKCTFCGFSEQKLVT